MLLLFQVCEWKSRWDSADLEAPSATAVEVHLTQHVCHSSRVRSALFLVYPCECGNKWSLSPDWCCSQEEILRQGWEPYEQQDMREWHSHWWFKKKKTPGRFTKLSAVIWSHLATSKSCQSMYLYVSWAIHFPKCFICSDVRLFKL